MKPKDFTLHKTEERVIEGSIAAGEKGELLHIFDRVPGSGKLPKVLVLNRNQAVELATEILEAWGMCGDGRCWRGPTLIEQLRVIQADVIGRTLPRHSALILVADACEETARTIRATVAPERETR